MNAMNESRLRFKRILSGEWLTAQATAAKLGFGVQSVQTMLRRFEKEGIVVRRPVGRVFEWSWK